MQIGVGTLRAHQFVVRSVLDDAATLDGDDSICAANRREAVSDHEYGAALAYLLHVVLDDPLALIIERARRLVEDQDARVGDERARDCDALTLTARQAAAALADQRIVALGKLEDEFMGPREGRRGDHLVQRHRRVGKRDIVAHRAIEQHVLLEHHAELSAQPGWVHHRKIDAIDQDPPGFGHVEALNELCERALAGARRPDDPDDLTGRHPKTDVVHDFRSVDPVAKTDMLEADFAADPRQGCATRTYRRVRTGDEDIAEPLHGKT